MGKTGMDFDYKNFNSGYSKLIKETIPGHAKKGLFIAGALIINYAITEGPRAPHKTGNLWRNQKVLTLPDEGQFIVIAIGFNTAYAARLHEAPSGWQWTLEGSGPKFLESSMVQHKDDAMKKAADHIQSQGRKI